MKEIMRIYVKIEDSYSVANERKEVSMILFTGHVEGDYFNGTILPGGVDTQSQSKYKTRVLSARYMVDGTDYTGAKCRMFVDNFAEMEENAGNIITYPQIVTDSKNLSWLQDTKLKGILSFIEGGVLITVYAEEEELYTKESLKKQLKEMGLKSTDAVMIHSSMTAIGPVEGGADTVLDALMEYFSEGLLMMPSHTWRQMSENYSLFDPDTEPACVGLLPNLFMKRPGVYRSLHPTHSIAAFGPMAEEYVKGEENVTTPCAPEGCWGRLPKIGAKILLLGVTHTRNTYLHGVEEILGVPERLTEKPVRFQIKMADGKIKEVDVYRHDNPINPHISENYDIMKEGYFETGAATKGIFGSAECILCDAKKLLEVTARVVNHYQNFFIECAYVPKEWYMEQEVSAEKSKFDYEASVKGALLETLIHLEWEAFGKARNEGGRAACQDDWDTFYIMRKSQYLTWTKEMLESYIYDFSVANAKGWNLIAEKYGHMMESTDPAGYDKIKDVLPVSTKGKQDIIEAIISIQISWMEEFACLYPKSALRSRSIYTKDDNLCTTSYETYLRGEMKTYSDDTLGLYANFIVERAKKQENLTMEIMRNTAIMYGYASLDELEAKI